jgi:molybdopterin synthase catalytic subunit
VPQQVPSARWSQHWCGWCDVVEWVGEVVPSDGGGDDYDAHVRAPESADVWLGVTDAELPVGAMYDWAVRGDCGAVVVFSGTVRDHADGRDGVTSLTYEAYESQVVPVFTEIVERMRTEWPDLGRVAMWHRVGRLELGESSVVVVVSAPHRPEAFEAARFGIDALKASAPIWKLEEWDGGSDWGTGAMPPTRPADVPTGNR